MSDELREQLRRLQAELERAERAARVEAEHRHVGIVGPDGRRHVEIDCSTGEHVTELGEHALAAIAAPLPPHVEAPDPLAELEARIAELERHRGKP